MRVSYLTVLLLIILPVLLFFLFRGAVTNDEGYILHSSERMVQGQMPYRDFHFVYTPLSLFVTDGIFRIFGSSIFSSRIIVLLTYLFSTLLLYKVVMLSTKNKLYATIAVFIFVAWGPTHINFSWPVVFAILTGILTCYLLMKFIETRKNVYLFYAGFACFLVFLAKQNFGASMAFVVFSFFSIRHARKLIHILPFLYGFCWAFIFFMIYLLATNSVGGFMNDFYIFTIKRIVVNSGLTTNFIYPDTPLNMAARTLLYLTPFIFSSSALLLITKRRRFHLIFLGVFVLSFYLVGIRPTTDYIHLVPLLSLIGIPIALLLRYNILSTARAGILLFSLAVIILGFQTALFKGYYRWDSPLITDTIYSANPRVKIFLNEKLDSTFKQFVELANKYTKPNDYILVNSYNPMIYFVTDRREPTKHNFISTGVVPDEYYKEVLGNLVAKRVKLVILDKGTLEYLPISDFIRHNYMYEKTVGDYDIYVLRS